jgi:hypothetical protein
MIYMSETLQKADTNCVRLLHFFSVNNRKVIRTWYIHVMSLMTCFLTSFYTGNISTAVTEVSRSGYITRNKNGLNILLDDQRPLPLKVALNFTFEFRGFWKQNRYLTISYKVFWFLDLDVQNITMFYSVAGLGGWLKNSEYVGSVFLFYFILRRFLYSVDGDKRMTITNRRGQTSMLFKPDSNPRSQRLSNQGLRLRPCGHWDRLSAWGSLYITHGHTMKYAGRPFNWIMVAVKSHHVIAEIITLRRRNSWPPWWTLLHNVKAKKES